MTTFKPSQWRLQKEREYFNIRCSPSAEHFVCRTHNGKRRDRLWNAVTFKRDANRHHHYGWVSLSHAFCCLCAGGLLLLRGDIHLTIAAFVSCAHSFVHDQQTARAQSHASSPWTQILEPNPAKLTIRL
jgi:hypothetical protein